MTSCATSHRANLSQDDVYYGMDDARRDFNKERRNPQYNARNTRTQDTEMYSDGGDTQDNNLDGRASGNAGNSTGAGGQTIINNYYNYGPSSSLWWFNATNVLWYDPWFPGWSFNIYLGPSWYYRPWWSFNPWYNPWAWNNPWYWGNPWAWNNPWYWGNPWAWNNPWYWNSPWGWHNPWCWNNPWAWNPYNAWAGPAGWAGPGLGGFHNVYYGPRRNMMALNKSLTLMNHKKGVAQAPSRKPAVQEARPGQPVSTADRDRRPSTREISPAAPRPQAPQETAVTSRPQRTREITTMAEPGVRKPYINPEYSADVNARPSVPAFRNTGQDRPMFMRDPDVRPALPENNTPIQRMPPPPDNNRRLGEPERQSSPSQRNMNDLNAPGRPNNYQAPRSPQTPQAPQPPQNYQPYQTPQAPQSPYQRQESIPPRSNFNRPANPQSSIGSPQPPQNIRPNSGSGFQRGGSFNYSSGGFFQGGGSRSGIGGGFGGGSRGGSFGGRR
ncbi:MAG: hypothetical protein NZM15_06135 [Flavobacteriales bacterium]|nr:hypothetical protein [Flavobacteriales bacterium]MDW8432263.1 hypothetical protein [Flavobacteriales bacterium]